MDKNLHFWSTKFLKFPLQSDLVRKKYNAKQFYLFIKKYKNFFRVENNYLLLYRDIIICIFL